MSTSLFVPDASVILKWAFRSPDKKDGDKALALLQRWLSGSCDFLLPKLWAFECGNVLGLKSPGTAGEIMAIFLNYRFSECDMNGDICATTLELMIDCQVTFYDAVYHAVALKHGGTLVTADAAYHRKACGKGAIILLDQF